MRLPLLLFTILISGFLKAKDFYLDLSDEHLHKDLDWPFQIDSVIDLRPEKEIIGFAFKGLFNKKKVTYLKRPLVEDLNRILITERENRRGEKLILRINHLKLYEIREPNQELAVAELNVSFIRRNSSGYTELFQAVSYITNKGVDATSWHGHNLIVALAVCMNDFEERSTAGKLKPITISSAQLEVNPYQQRLYPIQFEKIPKGLYYDFYDLRDNFVDTTITFYPDYRFPKNDPLRWATLDILTDNVSEEPIFAFSDGQSLFLKAGRRYFEIKDTANELLMEQFTNNDNSGNMAGIIASGIVGGIIGAGIYAGLSAVINPAYQKGNYKFDLEKGTVISSRYEEFNGVNSRIIFYGSSFNKKDEIISLSINGEKICDLPPYGYYVHRSNYKNEPLQACINYEGQEVCETITPEVFITETCLCRIDRKGQLDMDKVNGNIASTIDFSIANGESEEVCDK